MTLRIEETHRHGAWVCYVVTGGRVVEEKEGPTFGYYDGDTATKVGMYLIGGQTCILAYKPWTGSWYAYDPETGENTASFTRAFYDRHLKNTRVCVLRPDPDCLVVS